VTLEQLLADFIRDATQPMVERQRATQALIAVLDGERPPWTDAFAELGVRVFDERGNIRPEFLPAS
jgi:hypothetical protein